MLFSIKALLLAVVLISSSWFGIADRTLGSEVPDTTIAVSTSVQSGLNGTWKVGFDTSHRVLIQASRAGRYRVEIETVDGDGVRVVYADRDWAVDIAEGEERSVTALAKHGRQNHPITLRVWLDDNAPEGSTRNPILERVLTEEERGIVLPSEQPWVVGIGSVDMKLDNAMLRSARSNSGDYTYTELTKAIQVPAQYEAYAGVDLLVFSSSNTELLTNLSGDQADAFHRWVWQGGKTWLTLGKGAEAWFQHEALQQLVPGQLKSIAEQCNPGPLESFLNSQSRLDPYASAILDLPAATIELTGIQPDRTRYPLMARWSVGAGKVRLLATEIDSQGIQTWDSQVALIKLMLSDAWEGRGVQQRTLALADDITIQLRQALDRFEGLRMASLGQLCAILVALLAILGPIDYFIVARKWRMPRATWLSLIFTSLLACTGLAYIQKQWKPTTSSLNSLEFIDVDGGSGAYIGRAYSHFYGGPRGSYAIQNRTMDSAVGGSHPIQLNWLGQPGKGLGGFESTVATDRLLPTYRIEQQGGSAQKPQAEESAPQDTESVLGSLHHLANNQITHVGVPEAGTKGFISHWSGTVDNATRFGEISSHSGAIDLLDGTLVNPLDVEIHNAILIYRGRFYTLPLKFKPNDSFELNVTVVPKDFTRRLQRRINIDGKDQGTPWDRNETDLSRIAEMLSFHRAAAGISYTGLLDRYLSQLDLSELMKSERAILFGELADPQIRWEVTRNSKVIDVNDGNRKAMIRVLLPVVPPALKRTP